VQEYIKIWIVVVLFSSLLVIPSCKKDSLKTNHTDPVVDVIKTFADVNFPIDVQSRVNLAIDQWKNGVLNSKPILINAILIKAKGYDQVDLLLAVFDEDEDIFGFIVKEIYSKSDGKQEKMEETYPYNVHYSSSGVADMYLVSVKIRTAQQKKDQQLWKEYIDRDVDYEELTRRHIYNNENFSKESRKAFSLEFDDMLPPPVWISIPESNKVEVLVWVYDKTGNKSEPVKLLDFIDK